MDSAVDKTTLIRAIPGGSRGRLRITPRYRICAMSRFLNVRHLTLGAPYASCRAKRYPIDGVYDKLQPLADKNILDKSFKGQNSRKVAE